MFSGRFSLFAVHSLVDNEVKNGYEQGWKSGVCCAILRHWDGRQVRAASIHWVYDVVNETSMQAYCFSLIFGGQ